MKHLFVTFFSMLVLFTSTGQTVTYEKGKNVLYRITKDTALVGDLPAMSAEQVEQLLSLMGYGEVFDTVYVEDHRGFPWAVWHFVVQKVITRYERNGTSNEVSPMGIRREFIRSENLFTKKRTIGAGLVLLIVGILMVANERNLPKRRRSRYVSEKGDRKPFRVLSGAVFLATTFLFSFLLPGDNEPFSFSSSAYGRAFLCLLFFLPFVFWARAQYRKRAQQQS